MLIHETVDLELYRACKQQLQARVKSVHTVSFDPTSFFAVPLPSIEAARDFYANSWFQYLYAYKATARAIEEAHKVWLAYEPQPARGEIIDMTRFLRRPFGLHSR